MECHDHPQLMTIYNKSGLTTPDGMAVVWILKLKGYKQVARVYGPDLLLAACEAGLQPGWRHYFYGGSPEASKKLVETLTARFPGLVVAGTETPPFRPPTEKEDLETIRRIRAAKPDVVWVGLGCPRQERWMAGHLTKLGVPVLVGVGAAFDFISGTKRQAPRWVQRSGMEWFHRLLSEPKRLWKRYVLGYPRFVVLVAIELMFKKKDKR
jgi:N-acetylglucosaminyldiphosphoundecaprenol N-acetyl-beta-D-mannosaminyltransferase